MNFVQPDGDQLAVRTYERGVEDETFSCGTGVTAISLVAGHTGLITNGHARITTPGGNLEVKYDSEGDGRFSNIWLIGPATYVYKGVFSV